MTGLYPPPVRDCSVWQDVQRTRSPDWCELHQGMHMPDPNKRLRLMLGLMDAMINELQASERRTSAQQAEQPPPPRPVPQKPPARPVPSRDPSPPPVWERNDH